MFLVSSFGSEPDIPRRCLSVVLRLHGQGSNFIFRPRGLYTTLCHPVYDGLSVVLSTLHFVVPGVAGMSGLIGSWRPWAYPAWTISTPGQLETRLHRLLP